MNVIILGSKSDIYRRMKPLMEEWNLIEWRSPKELPQDEWDILLCFVGRVSPVGPWHGLPIHACVDSNVSDPITYLQGIWQYRRANASVCFFAGSNPQKVMPNYVPYATGKMALLKAVEHIDYETPEAKVFALAPGYVQTKIHKPTLEAGIPNERIARGGGTEITKIYDCLKWCIAQPKEVVGGRNICVSDPWGPELAERLKTNQSLYKLRRVE